jgi:hypothetical protein
LRKKHEHTRAAVEVATTEFLSIISSGRQLGAPAVPSTQAGPLVAADHAPCRFRAITARNWRLRGGWSNFDSSPVIGFNKNCSTPVTLSYVKIAPPHFYVAATAWCRGECARSASPGPRRRCAAVPFCVVAVQRSSSMERARARAARCVPRCWHAGESEAASCHLRRGMRAGERERDRSEAS